MFKPSCTWFSPLCWVFLPVCEDGSFSVFWKRDSAAGFFSFFLGGWLDGMKGRMRAPEGGQCQAGCLIIRHRKGRLSSLWAFSFSFMRAEGFLEAFPCWSQTSVLVPDCHFDRGPRFWLASKNRLASVSLCANTCTSLWALAWRLNFCLPLSVSVSAITSLLLHSSICRIEPCLIQSRDEGIPPCCLFIGYPGRFSFLSAVTHNDITNTPETQSELETLR